MKLTLEDGRDIVIFWKKVHRHYPLFGDKTVKNFSVIDTECEIKQPSGLTIGRGMAYVHTKDKNNHSKITGKKISLARALDNSGISDRCSRLEIWNKFKEHFGIIVV